MYAIIRSGGKQFRAEPGKTIRVPSLVAEPGDNVTFDVQNAQGDMATAASIAQKFAGGSLDLILGIATRLAAAAGIVWMLLFYTASAISPENNPFLDDHIIYAIVLAGIAVVGGGRYLGLGRKWERLSFAQKYPILR